MKRIISILMVLVMFVCLVSCNTENDTNEIDYETYIPEQDHNLNIEIWTDKETGVQYVIYDRKDGYGGMGGITPRLNADGTLYTGE